MMIELITFKVMGWFHQKHTLAEEVQQSQTTKVPTVEKSTPLSQLCKKLQHENAHAYNKRKCQWQ